MSDESHPESATTRSTALREAAHRLCKALSPTASALLRTDIIVRAVDVGPAPENSHDPAACRFFLGELASATTTLTDSIELHLSDEIAMGVVERLLCGSSGGSNGPARPPTDVERRILHRFVDVVRGVLRQTWNNSDLPQFRPSGDDAPPTAEPPQGRVAIAIAAELDGRTGGMWISLPGWAVNVNAPASTTGSAAKTQRAPVELAVYLPETTLPAEQADAIQPGDVIASGFPPDNEVTVSVAGIPKFVARLGRHNGKRAITILKRLGDEPPAKPSQG